VEAPVVVDEKKKAQNAKKKAKAAAKKAAYVEPVKPVEEKKVEEKVEELTPEQ